MGLQKFRMSGTQKGCSCPVKKTRLYPEGSETSPKGEIGIRFMY